MKRLFFIAGVLFLATSCGNKLKVSQIRTLQLEYSPGTPINFGLEFQARVKAILHDGEEKDVTTHRKFEVISSGVRKSGDLFRITKQPTSYAEDRVALKLSISDKEETLEILDTIVMNFEGGISFDGSGDMGADGEDQKDRGSRIILRDGKPGDDGTNGDAGFNGGNYEAHIWKEGELYYLYVRDINSVSAWKYKTKATSTVLFDISGGRGGDGGKGGGGGDGKDGSKDDDGKMKRPGDGGPGGNGGHGGNGGNGGSIRIIIHPDAAGITSMLKYNTSGGPGGEGGKGGNGGDAGDPLDGQPAGVGGTNGRNGSTGNWGGDGNVTTELTEFNTNQFK